MSYYDYSPKNFSKRFYFDWGISDNEFEKKIFKRKEKVLGKHTLFVSIEHELYDVCEMNYLGYIIGINE